MGSGAACQGCGRLSGVLQANLTPSAKVTALVGYLRTTVALIDGGNRVVRSPPSLRKGVIVVTNLAFQPVADAALDLRVRCWWGPNSGSSLERAEASAINSTS